MDRNILTFSAGHGRAKKALTRPTFCPSNRETPLPVDTFYLSTSRYQFSPPLRQRRGPKKLIGERIITAGGGLWHPNTQPLNLLRLNVDRNPQQLKNILAGRELAEEFFGTQASGDELKAVKAFTERNKEDALKTAPKVSSFLAPPTNIHSAGTFFPPSIFCADIPHCMVAPRKVLGSLIPDL